MQLFIEDICYSKVSQSMFVYRLFNSIRKNSNKDTKPVLVSTSGIIYSDLVNYLKQSEVVMSAKLNESAMLYTLRTLDDILDNTKKINKKISDIFIIDDYNLITPLDLKKLERSITDNNCNIFYQSSYKYFDTPLINFVDSKDKIIIKLCILENILVSKRLKNIICDESGLLDEIEKAVKLENISTNAYFKLDFNKQITPQITIIDKFKGEKLDLSIQELKEKNKCLKNEEEVSDDKYSNIMNKLEKIYHHFTDNNENHTINNEDILGDFRIK